MTLLPSGSAAAAFSNMVRIIAGTLVKIGMGVYPPEKMEEILEEKNRAAAGPTIPARGLTLVSLSMKKSWHRTWRAKISTGTMCSIREMSRRKGLAYLTIERCEPEELLTACSRARDPSGIPKRRETGVCAGYVWRRGEHLRILPAETAAGDGRRLAGSHLRG